MPSLDSLSHIESTIVYNTLSPPSDIVFTDETRSVRATWSYREILDHVPLVGQLLSRAVHTNDLALFTYCIGEMYTLFFATINPNSVRHMVRYHLNVLNIDITHPWHEPATFCVLEGI